MELIAKKEQLIRMLEKVQDMNILEQIEAIFDANKDWWDDLSPAAKASIQRGIAQADRGELKDNEEVKKKYDKWR